jgi:acyl-CoA thioester hydrolase
VAKPAGFSKTLYVGWVDLDANGHMRNTAYLDKAADVRMYYFAEHGFPSREFARIGIGPVVRKDEIEFFRELHLLDPIAVTLQVDALSADGARSGSSPVGPRRRRISGWSLRGGR